MYIHVLWLIPIVICVAVFVAIMMSCFIVSGRESEMERMREEATRQAWEQLGWEYRVGKQKDGVATPTLTKEEIQDMKITIGEYLEKRGVK